MHKNSQKFDNIMRQNVCMVMAKNVPRRKLQFIWNELMFEASAVEKNNGDMSKCRMLRWLYVVKQFHINTEHNHTTKSNNVLRATQI